MHLIDVYSAPSAADVLYRLLGEREATTNISHRAMPLWPDHVGFIERRPYAAWYLVEAGGAWVGATYLTHDNEIGIFIFKEHQGRGHGPRAVRELMSRHPREHYLANVNPANERSVAMFRKLGFDAMQITLEVKAA